MKCKEPNRQIELSVILNSTKQEVKFRVGIHTTLKEIGNLLADQLCLDIFRTQISFQQQYRTFKLDESKTLSQVGLNRQREILYANVETIHTKQMERVTLSKKQQKPTEKFRASDLDLVAFHPGQIQPYEVDGLTLEVAFVQIRSVLTSKGRSSTQLDLDIKCDMCPYRDIGLNPAVMVKQMQLKDCKWTISGKKKARAGSGYFEQCLNRWIRIEGKDTSSYQQIVGQDQWINVWIEIKPINVSTKNHPFLIQPDCLEDYYYSYF